MVILPLIFFNFLMRLFLTFLPLFHLLVSAFLQPFPFILFNTIPSPLLFFSLSFYLTPFPLSYLLPSHLIFFPFTIRFF